jgi:hypothetical protein
MVSRVLWMRRCRCWTGVGIRGRWCGRRGRRFGGRGTGAVACGGGVVSVSAPLCLRPPDLGYLVGLPVPVPWVPPPALVPWQDPYLLRRTLEGLRRL